MVIKQKHLIEFQVYYLMIVELLIDFLHFPDLIRYVLDVNAIVIGLLALNKIKIIVSDKVFKNLSRYIFVYIFGVIAVSLIRLTPVGRVAWAARNNFIYFVFFFCCAYTLTSKDFGRIMKNCIRLSFFNALCIAYEYLILGKMGDLAGGMFGIKHGCNGLLNVYLFVITAYTVVMFAKKKASLYALLWVVLSSLVIAAIAELKFFYIEFLIIVVAYFVLSRASVNNAFLLLGVVAVFFVAIQIIGSIRPDIVEFFSEIDNVTSYSKSTYGNTIINRGTAFSQIHKMFFGNDVKNNLIGFGFGYCEESKRFAWANSPFADRYGTMGYRNLSTAMLLLETGYIGLIGFVAIFVFMFIVAQKNKNNENAHYLIFSQIITILLIMNLWYNSQIRNPAAFFSFFALSAMIIPFRDKAREESQKALAEKRKNKKSYIKANAEW